MTEPFDGIAEAYDRWYDEPEGHTILDAELACLRRVAGGFDGRWLEVGVGTGRFASNLGIGEGVDPSKEMLRLASARGVETTLAKAESLPQGDKTFDGVLMVLALCFIQDAKQALRECCRVLRPAGTLLLGVVPADSPWGEAYAKKKEAAHPVYRHAIFRTMTETIQLGRTDFEVIQFHRFGVDHVGKICRWGYSIPTLAESLDSELASDGQ